MEGPAGNIGSIAEPFLGIFLHCIVETKVEEMNFVVLLHQPLKCVGFATPCDIGMISWSYMYVPQIICNEGTLRSIKGGRFECQN